MQLSKHFPIGPACALHRITRPMPPRHRHHPPKLTDSAHKRKSRVLCGTRPSQLRNWEASSDLPDRSTWHCEIDHIHRVSLYRMPLRGRGKLSAADGGVTIAAALHQVPSTIKNAKSGVVLRHPEHPSARSGRRCTAAGTRSGGSPPVRQKHREVPRRGRPPRSRGRP